MKYETLYEYAPESSKIFYLIPLLLFTIVCIGYIIFQKKYFKNFSIQRQIVLFFVYLFGGVSFIMTIFMINKIPKIISSEKQFKEIIQTKSYSQIEGEIDHFQIQEINGQYFESFSINNIKFEYSDYIVIEGFHRTSRNNGPIKMNGQYFRISYITEDSKNLILKLEIKVAVGST